MTAEEIDAAIAAHDTTENLDGIPEEDLIPVCCNGPLNEGNPAISVVPFEYLPAFCLSTEEDKAYCREQIARGGYFVVCLGCSVEAQASGGRWN